LEPAELEEAVLQAGTTAAARPVVAMLDGDLAGLAPQAPRLEGALIAIGPQVPLTEAAQSFAEASEALETAHAFGMSSTVELATLGPLPLALSGGLAAARLAEIHLASLGAQD